MFKFFSKRQETPGSLKKALEAFQFPGNGHKPEAILDSLDKQLETAAEGLFHQPANAAPLPSAANQLLGLSERMQADGFYWKDRRLRSYSDCSLQADLLEALLIPLFSRKSTAPFASISTFLQKMLETAPLSRPLLYLYARRCLDEARHEAALEAVQKCLQIDNTCVSSQELLKHIAVARPDLFDPRSQLSDVDHYLKDRFCAAPFKTLSTFWQGDTYACICPAWMPFPAGNLLRAKDPEEVWNSPSALELRKSILDGSFKYCSRTLCSFIAGRSLPARSEVRNLDCRHAIDNNDPYMKAAPQLLELNHDSSCNLACPSCRTEIRMAKAEETDAYQAAGEQVLLPLLKKMQGKTYITGGGEPFASKHFRSILARLNPEEFPGVKVQLISNGQLLERELWEKFPKLGEMLCSLSISIDAANKETYEILRRPGKWEPLLKNLQFLSELRATGEIPILCFNFVVQRQNYLQIPDFIQMGDRYGVDHIWFQKMSNYGSYDAATFHELDICRSDHPEHQAFLAVLKSGALKNKKVNAHMFQSLVPEFDLEPFYTGHFQSFTSSL